MMKTQEVERTEVSFRGEEIPEIIPKSNFTVTNSADIVSKISNMPDMDKKSVTINSVHFDKGRVSNVKLSTDDVVSVETAIGLAENRMLNGYTTGATMRGGKTLRSKPSTDENNTQSKGIYDLPRF